MDPNWNGQQWQQQYRNPNQQYAQPLQQQPTGTPHYEYSSTAQQTPYESQFTQQGGSQPSYQGLMQQMPTQQPTPNPQLQQQQSYQHYYQGGGSVIPSPSPAPGQWTQTQPNAQWQTATNNATTTTTTTTTTTKSTKETQASQPQYAASSSTTLDFASLIQQAPQQPPLPQPVLQQQQAYNYSQTMQSGNQQQTLAPPAPDFSRFMQNNPPPIQNTVDFSQSTQNNPPPTQNTADFSQFMQTAPPPQPPPQPQVSSAPPVMQMPTPQKAQSSKNASKSTNKSTTTTTTTVVGSASRQKAAEKGNKELRRFDRDVSNKLKQYGGICPIGWDYYATRKGYLCGGTNHFVSHDDVEALLSRGRPPYIELVNGPLESRVVTPPPPSGQMDGSGVPPTWEQDHGYFERYKAKRSFMESMGPYGY